ncbi:hypothetical protein [Candidatus Nitrosocosmicus oleophilus]|nr:hypothetical protein [Candidatus Nitrosocosmicus oleophilus]
MVQVLELKYPPVEATTISSIISSALSFVVINIIVRYIHVFGSQKL